MSKRASEEKIREWKENIAVQKNSGISIEAWCRGNKIPPHQFYYWKKKLSPIEFTRSSFTELKSKKETELFFECNGIKLYLDSTVDLFLLKQCLKALRDVTC